MKQQGLKKGSFILLCATAISKILGMVYKIPLTNLLGGVGMGYYASAYAIYIPVYTIISAGLPVAVTRLVAKSCRTSDFNTVRRIKRISAFLYFGIGIFGTVILIAFSRLLSVTVANNADCFYCIIMLAPSLAFCCLAEIEISYFEGMQNMYPTAISQVAESIAKTALGLTFGFLAVKIGIRQFEVSGCVFGVDAASYNDAYKKVLPFAAAGAMFGQTLSEIVGLIAVKIYTHFCGDGITRTEIKSSNRAESRIHIVKELTQISMPLFFGALISAISSFLDLATVMNGLGVAVDKGAEHFAELSKSIPQNEIPNFLYGSYNGLTGTVISFVPIVAGLLSKSALPSVSANFVGKNKAVLKHNIESIMEATLIFSVPAGFIICSLSKQILTVLYPSRALEVSVSSAPLSVMGISAVFVSIMLPVFSMLCAVGKEKQVALLTAVGMAVKLTLNIVLIRIPEINILGAAIASCLSNIVTAFIAMKILISATDCDLHFRRIFGFTFTFSGICSALIYVVKEILQKTVNELFSVAIAVFLGVLGYILLIFATKLLKYADFKAFFMKKPLK